MKAVTDMLIKAAILPAREPDVVNGHMFTVTVSAVLQLMTRIKLNVFLSFHFISGMVANCFKRSRRFMLTDLVNNNCPRYHCTREACEGNAFWSVCLSIWTRNSNTIAPIDLICLQTKYYTRGSVLFKDDPDRHPDIN